MKRIKELFESKKRKSLNSRAQKPPTVDGRIKVFESNGAQARQFMQKLRGSAGFTRKDVKADQNHKNEGALSDLPKFTPLNCNFFKQTISAQAQSKLLAKDRDRSSEARLTSDKTHPIYDAKNYKKFIASQKDKQFMTHYQKGATQKLISEMEKSSKELVYSGDQEKTEAQHIAEKNALIREIKHLRKITGDYRDFIEHEDLAKFNTHSQCKLK